MFDKLSVYTILYEPLFLIQYMNRFSLALAFGASLVSASPAAAKYTMETAVPAQEQVVGILWDTQLRGTLLPSAEQPFTGLPAMELSTGLSLWNAVQVINVISKIQSFLLTNGSWFDGFIRAKDEIDFIQLTIKQVCEWLWDECSAQALESSLNYYYRGVLLKNKWFDRELFEENLRDAMVELFDDPEHPQKIKPVSATSVKVWWKNK